MLSPAELELLSLAVAGECTPAEEAEVRMLLADSTEALRAFQKLQRQREWVRKRPTQKAPPELQQQVMARVARQPVPTPVEPQRGRRRVPVLVPAAIVASLLIAVSAGSFLLTMPNTPKQPFAEKSDTKVTTPNIERSSTIVVTRANVEQEMAPFPRQNQQLAIQPVPATPTESAPSPRMVYADFVASAPSLEQQALSDVQLRLPWLADIAEWQKPDASKRLIAELGKGPAFRLDLNCRDVHKAAELLLAAGQKSPCKLFFDPTTQERIQRKLPITFAMYTEAYTATEWAKFFESLFKPSDSPFIAMHLLPATPSDATDLRQLIGSEAGFLKRVTAAQGKPISAGTLDQVTNSLRGNTAEEKPSLFLTYGPTAARVAPSQSRAIKSYLDGRGERKPNTVPLLILVR